MMTLALLMLLAWAVIFFVTEIRAAQRGYDTWNWVKSLYNKVKWLQKVKW
jgi:hypothetical protein